MQLSPGKDNPSAFVSMSRRLRISSFSVFDPLETTTAIVPDGRSPYVQTQVSCVVKILVIHDCLLNHERNKNANV